MKTSERGIDLLKKREGCKLTAYKDVVGVLTIGFGHTAAAGPPVVTPGMTITQQDAENILRSDLGQYERAVEKAITHPISQNAFDALVSWTYNVGIHAMQGSTLIKRLNAGDYHGAADSFLAWNKAAGHVMAGLHKRREDERALFLKA